MSSLRALPADARISAANHATQAQSTQVKNLRLDGLMLISTVSTMLALATASECDSITHLPSLLYGAFVWGWWGVIASVFWELTPRNLSILRFSPGIIAVHVFVGSILGIAHLLLLGSLGFATPGWQGHTTTVAIWTSLLNINRFGIELLIYGFIFGISGIMQFRMQAQRDAIRSLELERQLSAAQLRALQMQLEPHFLFNTLNAITTLVEFGRQQEAVEMLSHLNAILKITLQRTTPEKVPLSQELEMVENYLAIEQVRFPDRLRIELKVDPSALNSLVPCFLLQPIVENAIRHGIARREDPGLVEASARREGDLLHLHVRDSGPGLLFDTQPGHGIGLRNTRERLAHFYQGEYKMRAQSLERGGFEVAITIPYECDSQ